MTSRPCIVAPISAVFRAILSTIRSTTAPTTPTKVRLTCTVHGLCPNRPHYGSCTSDRLSVSLSLRPFVRPVRAPNSKTAKKNYVGQVSAHLCVTVDRLSGTLVHGCAYTFANVHANIGCSMLFRYRVRSLYVTDGRTGKTRTAACRTAAQKA